MLQRAASNAYSWWWASHIRTKQSKWLEQSLQDMEEKVQGMLKLIEEDGDSFAKRAEMYYKRRPELINSVEEAYKVFRSLADRYDHLSKELQNANHTIATVFPEQLPFMDDDEDSPIPRMPKDSQIPALDMRNVPNIPKAPVKDFKGLTSPTAPKQFLAKKSSKSSENYTKVVVKSGLNKDEALEEIDKIQKNILALQTGKEFIKSSYEGSLAKYWEIENQIMEMQQKVCLLQDEFNVDRVIEDDEARSLMAEAALKSCQETLNLLQEKQEKSAAEAREEYKKIEAASLRLKSLKQKLLHRKTGEEKPAEDEKLVKAGDSSETSAKNVGDVIQETAKVEPLKEKAKEYLDLNSVSSLTMTELAEKIDELVNKVISLETAMSSQTVLVSTLRTDTDDLHEQIRNLEDEKETLIDDTQILSNRVKQLEEKLSKIHDLNNNVENQNSNLQTNFAEARSNLEHLSEKLSSVKPDEEVEEVSSSKDCTISPSKGKLQEGLEDNKDLRRPANGANLENLSEKLSSVKLDEVVDEVSSSKDTIVSPSKGKLQEGFKDKKDLSSPGNGANLENLSEKISSVKPDEDVNEVSSSKDSTISPSKGKLQEGFKDKKDLPSPANGANLEHLSEKLSSVKPDEEVEEVSSSKYSTISPSKGKSQEGFKDKTDLPSPANGANLKHLSEKLSSVKPDEEMEEVPSSKDSTIFPSEGKLQEGLNDKKDLPSPANGGSESFTAPKTEDIKDVKVVDLHNVQNSESSVPKQGEVEETTKKTVTLSDPKPEEAVTVDHCNNPVNFEAQGEMEKEEKLDWQQMLLSGMEDPDKVLLKEYNTLLKNYKEVKKQLHEMEKKERDSQFEITIQIRELKKAILKRDEEIQLLRQRLNLNHDVKGEDGSALPESLGDSGTKTKAGSEDLKVNKSSDVSVADIEDETKLVFIDTTSSVSIVEEKFRMEIDAILEENLDFWLRFSTTFHQIKKFQTEVQDLQGEIAKQKEKKKQEGSTSAQIKSDVRPIYKHLMEIQTELTVWLEQSSSLKDELKRRFASLCSIQEEITKALKEGVEEDEIRFSSHQAAKFQGEILNMKHENNKVREELEAGLDHVRTLQMEIEKTIKMLNEEFGISSDQPQLKQSMSQNRVPLRSFIFGTKPKKQKYSIFSSNRRYHNLKSGPL